MEIGDVVERVRAFASVRDDAAADPGAIKSAMRASSELRSWLAAGDAALARRLAAQVSFPEKDIADCTRTSLNDAMKTRERSKTLDAAPSFANALDRADITPAHVDALTRSANSLEDADQRAELFDRAESLAGVAASATVEEFRRRLSLEVKGIQRDDGIDRLERQRRATRLRTWVDQEGMWRFDGRFDPVTGCRLAARLDAAVATLFSEAEPNTCPSDPVEKQHHLRALAFEQLVLNGGGAGRPGRPEFVVVVDSSQGDGAGGPIVDWGLPVEVPGRVMAEMAGDANVHAVVVRNGVVLHAPGELDLGRSTRLASQAQRRALRALYRGCAIPGCSVRYDRCKLHHVIWWRNGGPTDLSNLLPLCSHHHSKVHDADWQLTLGSHRELSIRFPDGTVHTTGPPSRKAA